VDLSNPHDDAIRLCIIKRKSMQLLSISHSQIEMLKEIPLRTTAIFAVLRGSFLCIADAVNYSLVNLDSATLTPLLPISQDPPDSPPSEMHDLTPSSGTHIARPKSHQRPAILSIEDNEFLVASHTGSTTLGLFIKENGEPTRGTLEWASNVKSIGKWDWFQRYLILTHLRHSPAVDYPYIIALLQNNTIEVHSIHTQEIIQVMQVSSVAPTDSLSPAHAADSLSPSPATRAERIQPRSLVSTTAGFPSRVVHLSAGDPGFAPLLVPQMSHMNSLEKIEVKLVPIIQIEKEIPETQTAIHPPSTPKKDSALSAARPKPVRTTSKYLSTVVAKTLLVGKDSIFALCPLTLVVQAEALINNNRVEDALNLLAAVGPPDTPEKVRISQHSQTFCSLTADPMTA
jgi:hypothetical protein